jgi:CrcB protein
VVVEVPAGSPAPAGPAGGGSPFAGPRRSRWPRLHADLVAAVFAGGCCGGVARHLAGTAWPAEPGGFPSAVLAVNLAGAFVLAVVVVVAAELQPSRYLRPLLGTGFCGALTTFSAVVVDAVRLAGAGHQELAVAVLAANAAGGLAAAALGLVLARGVAERQRRTTARRR